MGKTIDFRVGCKARVQFRVRVGIKGQDYGQGRDRVRARVRVRGGIKAGLGFDLHPQRAVTQRAVTYLAMP